MNIDPVTMPVENLVRKKNHIYSVGFGKIVSYDLNFKLFLRVQVLEGLISRVVLLGHCESLRCWVSLEVIDTLYLMDIITPSILFPFGF